MGTTITLSKVQPEKDDLIWNSVINLSEKSNYQFLGKVVKGFGRGSKTLLMPTGTPQPFISNVANLEVQDPHKDFVNSLLPGVYCGIVEFVQNDLFKGLEQVKYRGVMCIGWIPHFDNKKKTIVIYNGNYL